jgi:hypothetical protein
MSDKTLRELAMAASANPMDRIAQQKFNHATQPDVVLGLLDETDALRIANKDLSNWFDALKTDHDALLDRIEELEKQLAEATDLAAGRLEIMQSDRKQALVWRDKLKALEGQAPIGYVFNDDARDFSGSVIRKLERFDYIPVFLAAGAKPEAAPAEVEGYPV